MKHKIKRDDKLILEGLFKINQEKIHEVLKQFLTAHYPTDCIIDNEDYLCAIGNIPIALVAHMDTVWEDKLPKLIFCDNEKGVMWSPTGLGADDKAGIFAILNIIESGLHPHVIFTHDEEIGGLGAEMLGSTKCPFKNLNYIIQLDRRGYNDCVFYDGENTKFMEYIEHFGFSTARGTFSDISILCPAWNVCGVNLSIGYMHEHSPSEILVAQWLYDTIDKVKQMLTEIRIPKFKWIGPSWTPYEKYMKMYSECYGFPEEPIARPYQDPDMDGFAGQVYCTKCGHPYFADEVMKVKSSRYKRGYAYYCYNCLCGAEISFCEDCEMPFEEAGGKLQTSLCIECKEKRGKVINYASAKSKPM